MGTMAMLALLLSGTRGSGPMAMLALLALEAVGTMAMLALLALNTRPEARCGHKMHGAPAALGTIATSF